MNQETLGQGALFLRCLLIGAGLGFGYDLLRGLRRFIPHRVVLVTIEDVTYWLSVAVVIIVLLYRQNYGVIRGYIFLGLLLGGGIYTISLGVIWIRCMNYCGIRARRLAGKVAKWFAAPYRKCIRICKKSLKKFVEDVKIALKC